jgi:1-acyl-sn-glycerol-3-phosphate acyltransferase
MMHWVAKWLLRLAGWRAAGQVPPLPKYVVIGAPHTSNWDFVIAVVMFYYFKLDINWMGKDSLFRWPFGGFFQRLGGIAINRSTNNNVVEQAVQAFNSRERMVLLLTPEGTRKKTDFWKSGFYYIATGARVPIALGFIDYKHKIAGFGPTFYPTGDIEADMRVLRGFYSSMNAKHPELKSEIRLRK